MIAELLAVAGATRVVIDDFGDVQPATHPGDAIRRHLLQDLPLGFRNPDTRARWADADPDEWPTERWTDTAAVVLEEAPTQQLPAPDATTSETTDDVLETVDWPLGELADDDISAPEVLALMMLQDLSIADPAASQASAASSAPADALDSTQELSTDEPDTKRARTEEPDGEQAPRVEWPFCSLVGGVEKRGEKVRLSGVASGTIRAAMKRGLPHSADATASSSTSSPLTSPSTSPHMSPPLSDISAPDMLALMMLQDLSFAAPASSSASAASPVPAFSSAPADALAQRGVKRCNDEASMPGSQTTTKTSHLDFKRKG
jgi:hypothetical protein